MHGEDDFLIVNRSIVDRLRERSRFNRQRLMERFLENYLKKADYIENREIDSSLLPKKYQQN